MLNLVIRQARRRLEVRLDGYRSSAASEVRKRASKIRKLFALTKEDDVRQYVNTYRREFESTPARRSPRRSKIQRPRHPAIKRKHALPSAVKKAKQAKSKSEAAEYHKLLALRIREQRERRSESLPSVARLSIQKA